MRTIRLSIMLLFCLSFAQTANADSFRKFAADFAGSCVYGGLFVVFLQQIGGIGPWMLFAAHKILIEPGVRRKE